MTKYEEIRESASSARKNFNSFGDRSRQLLANFIGGFEEYCAIPREQVEFLRWNGLMGDDGRYLEAEDGHVWSLPGAIVFDEEDGYWHIGMSITLSKKGVIPSDWVAFAIRVSEDQGQPVIKFGNLGKPQVLNQDDSGERQALYEFLIDRIMKSFANRRAKSVSKLIGFEVSHA